MGSQQFVQRGCLVHRCNRIMAAAVVSTALYAFSSGWAVAQHPDVRAPSPVQVSDARLVKLANGLSLYLIEDHRRPVVDIVSRVAAGSLHDPFWMEGLAELHGRTLRSGGSSTITADEIDEMLFGVDGRFSVSVKPAATVLSAQVPRTALDLGLSIVADVLMYPALHFGEIERQRAMLLEAAEETETDARLVALQALIRKTYGEHTPYGRTVSPASVAGIRRLDLVAFHSEHFRPNNTRIGIWGAFDEAEIVELVEMAFEGWEPRPVRMRRLPEIPLRYDSTVTLIHKPGATESFVIAGQLLPDAGAADHAALRVAASLITHRSAGRMNRLLRRDDVGAVEVFGDFVLPMRYPGLLYAGAVVRPSRAAAAAKALQREIERLVKHPPPEEEIVAMRAALARQMQREAVSVSFRLEQLLAAEEFGFPRDFFSRMIADVERVTPAAVASAARRYLRPHALHTVIVGSQSALEEAISMLGSTRSTVTVPD